MYDLESTPHARGSTSIFQTGGVAGLSLPRMRGDPPHKGLLLLRTELSTPHARGSTQRRRPQEKDRGVYPACAGIHPSLYPQKAGTICLPRMRGDPPHWRNTECGTPSSTPHARGST